MCICIYWRKLNRSGLKNNIFSNGNNVQYIMPKYCPNRLHLSSLQDARVTVREGLPTFDGKSRISLQLGGKCDGSFETHCPRILIDYHND